MCATYQDFDDKQQVLKHFVENQIEIIDKIEKNEWYLSELLRTDQLMHWDQMHV